MANFVTVTGEDGERFAINMDLVLLVHVVDGKTTFVTTVSAYTGGDDPYENETVIHQCVEDFDNVLWMINA